MHFIYMDLLYICQRCYICIFLHMFLCSKCFFFMRLCYDMESVYVLISYNIEVDNVIYYASGVYPVQIAHFKAPKKNGISDKAI